MERIKALLIEARTELKEAKAKHKIALDQVFTKATTGEGSESSATLLELVKIIGNQVTEAQARVVRHEQELGQIWDIGTKLYNNAANATSAEQTEKDKRREDANESFRKQVLGYCNGSRGVSENVEKWKTELPELAAKSKKYLSDDQYEELVKIANSVTDIKETRLKLTHLYELAYPHSKRPSGPREVSSSSSSSSKTAAAAASSKTKTSTATATPKSKPSAAATKKESSSDDESEVEEVKKPKEEVKKPKTPTTSAKKTAAKPTEDAPSSKKTKTVVEPVAAAPVSNVTDDDDDDEISSVASEEEAKITKKPKKSLDTSSSSKPASKKKD